MRWRLALSLAVSDLRGGAKGLLTFVTCLFLGIFAIAASGSASTALQTGLSSEARLLFGGDARLRFSQRELPAETIEWLSRYGEVTKLVEIRVMAEADNARRLVELLFVDQNYPLLGDLNVQLPSDGANWRETLGKQNNNWGALAFDRVFNELKTEPGKRLELPGGTIALSGQVLKQPDTLSSGFALAPRMILSAEALADLGFMNSNVRYQTEYRVLLNDPGDMAAFEQAYRAAWPEYVSRFETRTDGVNGLSDVIGRLELFLGFVGLTALIAGGLGVSAAARGIVESRQKSIATLKALGATGGEVQAVIAFQIAFMALLAILAGLVTGALTPLTVLSVLGDQLPFSASKAVFPGPLMFAALSGLIAAFAFAAVPLGVGRVTPPSALFRSAESAPPMRERIVSFVLLGILLLVGTLASDLPVLTVILGVGAVLSFLLFWGMGALVQRAARLVRPYANGISGRALSGLAGLGSLAPRAAPALGLGAALLFALVQIQSNLISQIEDVAPQNVPSMVLFQVPWDKGEAIDNAVAAAAPGTEQDDYRRTPMISTRLIALNGNRLTPEDIDAGNRWFLEDGLDATFRALPREPERLVEGEWWPSDYSGDLLVSLEIEVARAAGITLDDVLTFEILGRRVDARVINLRSVDWGGFGGNFAVMFSPGTLEAANPNSIVLMRLSAEQDDAVVAAIAEIDAGITIFRVREALDAAARIFSRLTLAIKVIAFIAILSGVAACIAALAAGMRSRVYEAAIHRTLGASRLSIIMGTALEISLTALLSVIVGGAIGLATAWYLIVIVFEADWIFAWGELFSSLLVTATAGLVAGLIVAVISTRTTAYRILSAGS